MGWFKRKTGYSLLKMPFALVMTLLFIAVSAPFVIVYALTLGVIAYIIYGEGSDEMDTTDEAISRWFYRIGQGFNNMAR